VVTERINYDLMKAVETLGCEGTMPEGLGEKLLGR
jgi:hypothetical protein